MPRRPSKSGHFRERRTISHPAASLPEEMRSEPMRNPGSRSDNLLHPMLVRTFALGVFMALSALAQEPQSVQRAEAEPLLTVIVQSDRTCLFAVDGRSTYKAAAGTPISIEVTPGEHAIAAVTIDGKDIWKGRWNVNSEGAQLTIPLEAQEKERLYAESEAAALKQ